MRVTAAISTWLAVGILAGFFSIVGPASADDLVVEPDDFPQGTDLTDKTVGVTLSVEGHPGMPVSARLGTLDGGPLAGINIAPTGTLVFGHELVAGPPPPEDFRIIWTTGLPAPVLRADFAVPVDFVSIDARATDDDTFELQAYDASNNLLDIFNTGVIDNIKVTMSIARPSPDIAYILAFGVAPEGGGLLDSLRVNLVAPVVTGLTGPFIDNVGVFESFDVNADGFIDQADKGRIGVGLDQSQYFLLRIRLMNVGADDDLDDVAFWDGLREHFAFAPLFEEGDDGCADGTCDGVGEDLSGACPIALSGPAQKKGELEPRTVVITPENGFPADATCEVRLYLKTKEAETRGRGQQNTAVFEPSECTFSGTFEGGQVADPVPVNEGVDTINEASETKLDGPLGTSHVYPVCP